LGYRDSTSAVVIGTGHLGGALLNYPNFEEMGLKILAGFDVDPSKIGTKIGGKEIFALDKLPNLSRAQRPHRDCHGAGPSGPRRGGSRRQKRCPRHLEFRPDPYQCPDNIVIETVNLASSLAVLSHRLNSELSKED
jgi:redox-sensing transcriptional repressor